MHGVLRPAARLALLSLVLQGCGSDATGPSAGSPTIASIGPNRVRPQSGPFSLVVNGGNFRAGSLVQWNGASCQTSFVDSTRLVASIPGADVAVAGTVEIRVLNPDGRRSGPATLIVAANAVAFGADSLVPPCCGDASAGVLVAVYFNEPLDPASVGDSALEVLDGSTPVPGVATYDAATRSLRFSTPLPALRSYTAWVSVRVRSTSGGAPPNRIVWNFTTARGALVVLDPSGDFASLALGFDGRPRIAYRWGESVTFSTSLQLASCGGDCTRRSGWSTALLDGGGKKVGSYASLAADPGGGLHVAYQDFGADAAKYALVGGGSVIVEGGGVGAFTSLAVGPASRLYLTYYAAGRLRSATCAAACTIQSNWALTTVDSVGNVGSFSSVAVDASARVHVTYFENNSGVLRYATCQGPCVPGGWIVGVVDSAGRVGIGGSLVVDSHGTLHVTYADQTHGTVKYATCPGACDVMSNWTKTVVAAVAPANEDLGFYAASLALGPADRLDVAFANLLTGEYEGATCSAACTGAGAWTVFPISLQGAAYYRLTSLKVDGAGNRHLAWNDATGALKYMQYQF
jgi:hypothetical protein